MSKLLWLGILLVTASADCDASCLTCGADGSCASCAPLAALQDGSCVCTAGSYPQATVPLSCGECDPSCATCSGPSEFECLSCPVETTNVGPTPSRCVCETDHTLDLCYSCYQTCATCDYQYQQVCTACKPGFEMYSGFCVPRVQFSQVWATYSYYFDSVTQDIRALPNNRREQADIYVKFGTVRDLSDVTLQVRFPTTYRAEALLGITCQFNDKPAVCSSEGLTVNVNVPAIDYPLLVDGWLVQNSLAVSNVTNPDFEGGTGFFYLSVIENRSWRDDARTVQTGATRFYSREYGRYEDELRAEGQLPYETYNLDSQMWKIVQSRSDLSLHDFNVPIGTIGVSPAVDTLLSGEVLFTGPMEMATPTQLEFRIVTKGVLRPTDSIRLTIDPQFSINSDGLDCSFLLPSGELSSLSCSVASQVITVSLTSAAVTSNSLSLRVSGLTTPPHSVNGCTNFRAEVRRGWSILERLDIQGPVLTPGEILLVRRAGADIQDFEYAKTNSVANISVSVQHWVPAGGSVQFVFEGLSPSPASTKRENVCFRPCEVHNGAMGLNGGEVGCGRFDSNSFVMYNFEAIAPGTVISVSMFVYESGFTGSLVAVRSYDAGNNVIDELRTEGVRKPLDAIRADVSSLSLTTYVGNATTGIDLKVISPNDLLQNSVIKISLPTGTSGFVLEDKLDCWLKLNGAKDVGKRLSCHPDDQHITITLTYPMYAGHTYDVMIRPTLGGCLGQFRNPMKEGCYPVGVKLYSVQKLDVPVAVYQTAFAIDTRGANSEEAEVFLWTRQQSRTVSVPSSISSSLPTIWTIYYTPSSALLSHSYVAFMLKNLQKEMDANAFRSSYCFRNGTEVPITNSTLAGFAQAPADTKAYLLYAQQGTDGDSLSGFKFWFPSGLQATGTYRFDVLGVAGNGNADTELWIATWRHEELQQFGKVKTLTNYFPDDGADATGDFVARASNDKYFPGEVADISFKFKTVAGTPVNNKYFAVALPSGFQFTPSAALTFQQGTDIKIAQHTTASNSPQAALIWGWTDGTVNLVADTTYTVKMSGVMIPLDKCETSQVAQFYAGDLGKAPIYAGIGPTILLYFNRTQIPKEQILMNLGPANEIVQDFYVEFPVTQAIPWNGFATVTFHTGFLFDYLQQCTVTGAAGRYLCTVNSMTNTVNITDIGPVAPGTRLRITFDKVRMPNTVAPFEPFQIVTYGCCRSETCSGLEESKYFLVTLLPPIPTYAKVLKVQFWPINIGYPGEVLIVFKLSHDLLPRSRLSLGVPLQLPAGSLASTCKLLNMTGETWQITPDDFNNGRPKYLVSYTSCVADANFVNVTFSNYIPQDAIMGLHLMDVKVPTGLLNYWSGQDYMSNVPVIFNNFSVSSESYNRTVDAWQYNSAMTVTQLTSVPVNYTFDRVGTRPYADIDVANIGEYKAFTFALKTQRLISADEQMVITFGSTANWYNEVYLYQGNLDGESITNCWSERSGLIDCVAAGNRVIVKHRKDFAAGQEIIFSVRRPIPNEVAGDFSITIWSMSGDRINQALSTSITLAPTSPPAPLNTVSLTSTSSLPGGDTDLAVSFLFGTSSAALTIRVSFSIIYMWYAVKDTYECSLLSAATGATFTGQCSGSLMWREVTLRLAVPQEYWKGGVYTLTIRGFANPTSSDNYSVSTLAVYNAATKHVVARTYGQYSSPLTWTVQGPGPNYLTCDNFYIAMTAGSVSQPIAIYEYYYGFFASTVQLEAVVKSLESGTQESHKFYLREPVVLKQGDDIAYAYIVAAEDVVPGYYYVTWEIVESSLTGTRWYNPPGDVNIKVGYGWQNVTVSPTNFVPIGGDSMPIEVSLTTPPASLLTVTLSTNAPDLTPYPTELLFGPSDQSQTFILSAGRQIAAGDYTVSASISGPQHFHLSTPTVTVTAAQFANVAGTIDAKIVLQAEGAIVRQVRSQPGVGYFMLAPAGTPPLSPKELVTAVHTATIPTKALDNALSSEIRVFREYSDRFEINGLTINMPYVLYACLVNSFGLPGPITAKEFLVMTEPRFLATVSAVMYAGEDSAAVVQRALAIAVGAQVEDFMLKEVVESDLSRFGHISNFTYYVNTMTFGNYEREPNMDFLAAAAPDLQFTGISLRQFSISMPTFLTTPQVLLTADSVQVSVLLDMQAVVGVVIGDESALNSYQIINGLASNNADALAAVSVTVREGESMLLMVDRPAGNFTVWVAAENDIPFYPLRTEPLRYEVLDGLVTK